MDLVTYVSDTMETEHLASALRAAGFEVGRFTPLQRTLLDTFDGRLHAAGIRLEIWQGPGMDLVVSGDGPAPARTAVDRMPSVAGDLPAGPLRARLVPVLDVRALLPTVSVTTHHALAERRNDTGKTVVSVALHARLALASGGSLAVRSAAEVSPFEGYPKAAREAGYLLGSLGLTRCDGDLLDVAADATGIDLRGVVGSPTVSLDPAEPAVGGFRRVLANLSDTIDANWQGRSTTLTRSSCTTFESRSAGPARCCLTASRCCRPRAATTSAASSGGWVP